MMKMATLLCLFSVQLVIAASAEEAPVSEQKVSRIDFGNSMIMGQSIKSGAVYLTNRKKSDIKSILKKRESYRDEILDGFAVKDKKLKVKQFKNNQ